MIFFMVILCRKIISFTFLCLEYVNLSDFTILIFSVYRTLYYLVYSLHDWKICDRAHFWYEIVEKVLTVTTKK